MKTRTIVGLIALALLLAAPSAFAAKDKRARLDAGEVLTFTKPVPGSTLPQITGMAVIDAPPQMIWRIIDRCGDYKKTMPRTLMAAEISRKGNKVRCTLTVDMPYPLDDLTSVTDSVHTVVPGKKYVRAWTLVRGDYTKNDGSWTIVPFNESGTRSLVVYKLHVEPKTDVPDAIKRAAQKRALPDLMEKLRSHFRSR